jgi:hypothetical protein
VIRSTKRSSAVLAMGILLSGCPVACSAQKAAPVVGAVSYRYDTAGIRLEGTLTERKEYGPPGYGETPSKDEKTTILVLKLSHPITVQPAANAEANGSTSLDPVKDVREVQLYIPKPQVSDARKLLGKVVVAVGTLNEAAAPSQYTKVWLDTQTVNAK